MWELYAGIGVAGLIFLGIALYYLNKVKRACMDMPENFPKELEDEGYDSIPWGKNQSNADLHFLFKVLAIFPIK